jgi:hypothetical protein
MDGNTSIYHPIYFNNKITSSDNPFTWEAGATI